MTLKNDRIRLCMNKVKTNKNKEFTKRLWVEDICVGPNLFPVFLFRDVGQLVFTKSAPIQSYIPRAIGHA